MNYHSTETRYAPFVSSTFLRGFLIMLKQRPQRLEKKIILGQQVLTYFDNKVTVIFFMGTERLIEQKLQGNLS